MKQNPVQLDPWSLWLTCCRASKPRAEDGECFTRTFPVCPPCQSTSALEPPQCLSSSEYPSPSNPSICSAAAAREQGRMKGDSTARAKCPSRQRSAANWACRKTRAAGLGRELQEQPGPASPSALLAVFITAPAVVKAFLWTSG